MHKNDVIIMSHVRGWLSSKLVHEFFLVQLVYTCSIHCTLNLLEQLDEWIALWTADQKL